jgi:hypothetical protein
MFSYFKAPQLKVVIAHSTQVDIVKEIEKKFKDLIVYSSKDQQTSNTSNTFKLQAKSVLELIKFSLEKYAFDENIEDTILGIGDSVVSYVTGYTQRKPVRFMNNIRPSEAYEAII